jgi:predicted transcriptional regulator
VLGDPTEAALIVAAEKAGDSALARVRESIFQGSAEKLFAHFVADENLSRTELERMRRLLADRLGDES